MSTSSRSNATVAIIRRTGAWWSVSGARARLTALGAMLLIVGLLAASVIVWISPANPVARAVAALSGEQVARNHLTAERDALLKQVTTLQRQLVNGRVDLTLSKNRLAEIQQKLWSAQGEIDAMNTARQTSLAAAQTTAKIYPKSIAALPSAVSAPTKSELVNPASRYFGLFTDQAPFNYASFDAISAKIGSTPNSVGYFGGWDQSFRGDVVSAAWKRGQLPVLTWESRPILAGNGETSAPDYSLQKIIAGDFDAYLRQYATDIVATGLPLGVRLDHEMNGIWYPWSETDGKGGSINSNAVGDYAKMWQHVHDIFQQQGANDLVVWIWSPNIVNNLPATHRSASFLAALYPGDSDVDFVGLSGYLRPPYVEADKFSFDYTFGASLAQLRSISTKPIFLAEVGASETGGHKADWITSLFAALADPGNSDIVGFSWFNQAVTTYTEGVLATNDWRIDSRPESLTAFREGLARPGSNFILKQ